MLKFVLILTVFFSLIQTASAERWLGLIASIAALEASREPLPDSLPALEYKAPIPEYKAPAPECKVCTTGSCSLAPIPTVKVTTKTVAVKKILVPKKQSPKKWRFRLFHRNCSNCGKG